MIGNGKILQVDSNLDTLNIAVPADFSDEVIYHYLDSLRIPDSYFYLLYRFSQNDCSASENWIPYIFVEVVKLGNKFIYSFHLVDFWQCKSITDTKNVGLETQFH